MCYMESKMQERYDHGEALMEDIGARLNKTVAKIIGKPEESLYGIMTFKALGFDKLDFVKTIHAVEEEFHIEIPEREYSGLNSMADLFQFVIHNRPT
jgi:acyl carrier protein